MNTITALPASSDASAADTRLSIEGLILLLWSRKVLFLAVMILFAALLVTYAFVATPVYQVDVKMMPRQGDDISGGGLQSLLGQFGGIASLAGLGSLGISNNEQEDIALLGSRALFQTFAQQENLLPILFHNQWDPVNRRWRPNLKRVPTMEDAWRMFDHSVRHIDQDPKTRVVTLRIRWRNGNLAAAWANELVDLENQEVQQRALREAQLSLTSLQQQLGHTDAVELRDSIYRLMEAQINRQVIARSRPDYAFTVIDPAVVPDANKFVSPRRALLVFIALPFGLAMGAFAVLALDFAGNFLAGLRRLRAASP